MRFEIDSYLKIEETNINIKNDLYSNYDSFSSGNNMNLSLPTAKELIENINIMRKRVDTDEIKEFVLNIETKVSDAETNKLGLIALSFEDINYFIDTLDLFVKNCKTSLNLR